MSRAEPIVAKARRHADRRRPTGAGTQGVAVAPPPSGVDVVDRASREGQQLILPPKAQRAPESAEPAPLGFEAVTLAEVEAEVAALRDYKTSESAITDYVVGSASHRKGGVELTLAQRREVARKIGRIRLRIELLTPENSGLTADALEIKKGDLYLEINRNVPFSYQMANLDILYGILGKKAEDVVPNGPIYNYSHGPGRTCNVTVLTMALEGLGYATQDADVDAELMGYILEWQSHAHPRVTGSVAEGQVSAADGELHKRLRKAIGKADLATMRFADFIQLAVIYFYATGTVKVHARHGNGTLGHSVQELKELHHTAPGKFADILVKAHENAASGVLVSDNFPLFIDGLFNGVEAHTGEIIEKSEAAFKARAIAELLPLLRAGKQIEINPPHHFVHLVDIIPENGIVINEVGGHGGRHKLIPWKEAHEGKGWLKTYVVYERRKAQ